MSETIEFTMKLGDVIQVSAPTNPQINNKIYYIDYIDDENIVCVDLNDGSKTTFDLDANGCLTDTTITQITLLSRSPVEGYAAQHDLVAGKYIKMVFDFQGKALTLHGKIIANDEDMIQIQASDDQIIFIDFEYKGIPKHIPLTHISIVEPLTVLQKSELKQQQQEKTTGEEEAKEEATMDFSPDGNPVVKVPPNPKMDAFKFEDSYSSANLGEEVEFEAEIEVAKGEQRYGIEVQTNDLLDELLSTIPDEARTSAVMEKIHRTIRRFKELRAAFSTFDEHGNVTGYNNFNALYKPLVKELASLNANLKWIVPVVKQVSKINDNITLAQELDDYDSVVKMQNLNNRYVTQYNAVNHFFTPFTNADTSRSVKTEIEAVIDNLGNFDSEVSTGIRKYVFQRYNLGQTKISNKILRSGKSVYVREPFTRNDTMDIKSVLVLPKPIMEFSRVQLPGTDILQRTALSHNWLHYYRLLRKKTAITKLAVEPNKEVDYKDALFGNAALTYTLPDDVTYDDALQSIIPRSVELIRALKSQHSGYNFNMMLSYFEPFLMDIHNITYSGKVKGEQSEGGGPYQELRVQIRDNVKNYIAQFIENRKKYKQLSEIKSLKELPNPLLNNIAAELLNKVTKEYRLSETMTASEVLTKINSIDNGAFYYSVVSFIIAYLYTPDLSNLTVASESYKSSTTCNTRVIAKKYTSFKDLQKDNGNENVYFDKDYDSTPYDILKKYSASQQRMSNSEFVDYLSLVLQKEHGVTGDSVALAQTIIAKQKPVVDGNYAVLVIYPKKTMFSSSDSEKARENDDTELEADIKKRITYFVRKGDNWVQETEMSEAELTNELMCNTSNKCFFDKNKEFCDSVENAAKRMKRIAQKQMIGTSIALSMEDFRRELAKDYDFKEYALKKTRAIKEAKAEQYSLMAYTIGTRAVLNEVVVSPHASLLSNILDMVDFSKRQEYIIKFKDDYCREPVVNDLVNESVHWFYCKETNVKLMPYFLYSLAQAFFNGHYEDTLDYICFHQGKKSDDGEAVVDKHSGYVIRYLDFSTEEEYDDQGFKMKTRSVMEQGVELDDEPSEMNFNKGAKKVFENPLHQQIHNVSKAIVEGMHLDFDELENNIMVHSVRIVSNTLLTADMYAAATAGKKTVPYDTYKNRHVFFTTAACAFICIQSQIPSLRPKKTFPGCVFSFRGYPLEQVGDQTGIKYLACMLEKMRNAVADPWKSVSKLNAEMLQKGLVEWLDKQVLPDQKITRLLEKKRAHLLLEPDTYVPDEHNVEKWTTFQPPLINPGIEKTVNGVGNGFEAEAAAAIKSGHKSQHDHLGTMYKKIIEHTFATFEQVNKIVQTESKDVVAKPSFWENSCCESSSSTKCIDYFAEKDANVRKSIDLIGKYERIYNDIKSLTVAPYLTSKTSKTVVIGEDRGISTRNMYEAFIHYCKLRSDLSVPDDLKTVCQEKLPGLASMSIEQAIEALEDHGKKQNMNTLLGLMTKIAERNRVQIQTEDKEEPEFHDAFEDNVLGKGIRVIIQGLSDNAFKANAVLINSNKAMLDAIQTYLTRNARLSNKELKTITQYLDSVSTWSDPMKIHNFIYSSIKNIITRVPTMLKNKSKPNTEQLAKTKKHWELAPRHYEIMGEFIDGYYAELHGFKGDANLYDLMTDIHDDLNMKDVLMLLERLSSMKLTSETQSLVYKFCYLAVFYEMVLFSQDLTLYNNFTQDEREDEDFNMTEVELQDQRQEFYQQTAKLMATLLSVDMKNKKALNFNYEELLDSFRKEALVEKKSITDRFKNMQKDERNTELLLKKYKMGRWNLGEQKGIYQYDKALYEQEVETKKPENMTVDELEQWEKQQQEDQEAQEAYDDVGMDGDYYPEDREDEFRDD